MLIEYASEVSRGILPENDDRALVNGEIVNESAVSGWVETPACAVVCDGCGGYAGGGYAAETVLDILSENTAEDLLDEETLAGALAKAENELRELRKALRQYSEMCTTVVGCVVGDEKQIIFHSGDSRMYRYDGFSLAKMTTDHSAVQEMVDRGLITPEEIRTHPSKNIVTRCMGIGAEEPELYISGKTMAPGDVYILCSDGLWEFVTEREMRKVLEMECPLKDKARVLAQLALENGSEDNISVLLYAFPGESGKKREEFVLD